MRNITDIIKDDRNGKQLSQTERQIAVAYIQGKYDAVRELKIGNNDAMEVLDKIRADIISYEGDCRLSVDEYPSCKQCTDNVFETIYGILDKHKRGGNYGYVERNSDQDNRRDSDRN